MKFIHISDLHFHMNTADNIAANKLLSTIREQNQDHKLIVTGDITDDGHPKQFKNAYDALKPFLGNVFIAPGNHDFGAKGNFYSRERARRFDEMLSTPLDQGGTFMGDNTPVINMVEQENDRAILIALDTNLETYTPFDFACGAVGDAAELSLLEWVVKQVDQLRGVEGFEDVLLGVFKKGTKTRREVRAALTSGDLASALHIASRWSGAGFDVLGLEQTADGLVPVRYECKGIAASSRRIRIHLSRNELGVARRVRREGNGKWLLVGVQPDGVCVDLTGFLQRQAVADQHAVAGRHRSRDSHHQRHRQS